MDHSDQVFFSLSSGQSAGASQVNAASELGSDPKVSEPSQGSFELSGAKAPFYQRLSGEFDGQGVELNMTSHDKLIDVGGFFIKGDPSYSINGDFAGVAVQLKVEQEKLLADAGGFKVQTGTLYHVQGELDGKEIQATVSFDQTTSNVGGIPAVTDRWAEIKHKAGGGTDARVKAVSEVKDLGGGVLVETDRYHRATALADGSSLDVDLRAHETRPGFTLDGQVAKSDAAVLVALSPFLS